MDARLAYTAGDAHRTALLMAFRVSLPKGLLLGMAMLAAAAAATDFGSSVPSGPEEAMANARSSVSTAASMAGVDGFGSQAVADRMRSRVVSAF